MTRRCLLGLTIALLLAGSVAFAQDHGRTVKSEFTFGWTGAPFGPCGDGVILNSAEIMITEIARFDQDGTLVQSVLNIRTLGSSIYYLAESPENPEPLNDKVVMGVPGEMQTERLVFAENRAYIQGSIFQATVPGYGRIFSETGHTVFDVHSWTPTDWAPLSSTGHNDFADGDLAALCAYLSQ